MNDSYNDRALNYHIRNCNQPVPTSILGKRYDSKCTSAQGLKKMQHVPLDIDFQDRDCDYDAIYYSTRVERPIGKYNLINRKYLQFSSELEN